MLLYIRGPPTHYYLESSGQVAYMKTHPKTTRSHDNFSRSYIFATDKKPMVDPRISKDRNTSMPGHLFQDINDTNIQVAWMRSGTDDRL